MSPITESDSLPEGVLAPSHRRLTAPDPTPTFDVRPLIASDIDEVRGLFLRSFGHAMTDKLWLWKYGENRGLAVVARDKLNRVAAHYGGMRRDIHFRGQPAVALQIGDVMVPPEARQALSRNGPFFQVSSFMLDNQIGYGKPHLLGFGFPNTRAMRLGEKLGLYAEVDQIIEASWDAKPCLSGWWKVSPIDLHSPSDASHFHKLSLTMRKALVDKILPVRSLTWWEHRYAQNPTHQYKLLWLTSKWFSKRLGAFVLRVPGEHNAPWELMDWVCAPAHISHLVCAARSYVAQSQGASVNAWCTSSVANWLTKLGGQRVALDVRIPTSIRQAGPAPEDLRGRWWLTGGDTDFR